MRSWACKGSSTKSELYPESFWRGSQQVRDSVGVHVGKSKRADGENALLERTESTVRGTFGDGHLILRVTHVLDGQEIEYSVAGEIVTALDEAWIEFTDGADQPIRKFATSVTAEGGHERFVGTVVPMPHDNDVVMRIGIGVIETDVDHFAVGVAER
jgi:hypothetical protein